MTQLTAIDHLRERLGLPPPSPEDVARLQRDVDDIVKTIVKESPQLREWAARCRSVIQAKHLCDRDVFGNCDRCDRRST